MDSLGDSIVNGVKAIFVPDKDSLELKINSVKSRFEFVFNILDTFKNIINGVSSNGSPPVIKIPGGKYNDAIYIDFSWYQTYKPLGDKVILAFMYGSFVLGLFKNLPSIISGASAIDTASSQVSDIQAGQKEKKRR